MLSQRPRDTSGDAVILGARLGVPLALALGALIPIRACGGSNYVPQPNLTGPLPPDARPSALSPPSLPSVGRTSDGAFDPEAGAPAHGSGVVGPEGIAAWDALPVGEKNKVRRANIFFGHQSVG